MKAQSFCRDGLPATCAAYGGGGGDGWDKKGGFSGLIRGLFGVRLLLDPSYPPP